MEELKILSEKEVKKIVRESRQKEVRNSIIQYLIEHGESTLSSIMNGITSSYVMSKDLNYHINFFISRKDVKEALSMLKANECVEFIGGHKWIVTEIGIKQLEVT